MTMAPETTPNPDTAATEAVNLRYPLARDVFEQISEISEDMETRPNTQNGLEFLRALLAGPTPEEAITFAAYALSPRHSVWWAHECLNALPELLTDQDKTMLALCAAWAANPAEDSRYDVLEAGLGAETRGPGVWIALGAGWSAGSMSPADQPEVPVQPFLTGRAVNAGVLSILARVPQDKRRRHLGHFVSMADYLAKGS